MTQKGNGKRKQAPAYSADAMAVRYMAGLALIALGVLVFMAVALRLQGNIFEGLRRLCFGLCGILAYVLPVLPVWAGVLVIWSTQRKAPVRPWLYAFLAFFGVCTLMMVTGAMQYLRNAYGSSWGAVINGAFADSANRMERASGGGALGAILAWPLWRYLGPVLGSIIVFLLTALCVLLAVDLTPSRLYAVFTGQADSRREQKRREREQAEQQAILAQQQQQAYWAQQQQIIEQQQPYNMPLQNTQGQGMPQQPVQQPWPEPQGDGGVRAWQEQAAPGQWPQEQTGHQSGIFGPKKPEKPAAPEKGFVSRIFSRGRKEEEYDGLSDGTTLQDMDAAHRAAAAQNAKPPRRTATGAEIAQPQTHWQQEPEPEETFTQSEPEPARRPRPAQQTVMELPEEEPAAPAEPEQKRKPAREDSAYRRPAAEEKKPEAAQPVRPAVPVVQQEIGTAAYKPKLKVPEKKEEPEEDEGEWIPTNYVYPSIMDLARPQQNCEDTREEDQARSMKLEETLASFKVQARVVHVTHGPAISRFELELAAGTKVSKISELEKDIAYGMSATEVRIEAPIPGKRLVGV